MFHESAHRPSLHTIIPYSPLISQRPKKRVGENEKWNLKLNIGQSVDVTFTKKTGDCPDIYKNGAKIPEKN